MNVKLAWEIGWKLGMAKRAGLPDVSPGVPAPRLVGRKTPDMEVADAGPISLSSRGSGAGAGVNPAAKGNGLRSLWNNLWGNGGGAGAAPDPKGVLSIGSAGGGAGAAPDPKGVLSIGSAGGGSAANSSGVLELDPSTRKYLGGGGGQQGQENNFWSSVPSPANSQQTTADMYSRFLGFNSPADYSGWREAQTSGLGRALKARGDNQFVRMMLGNM
jgi:hypothetical protein